ncbi:hypothetical protein [Oribacterium sp. WCC10]|uniref:hypothetical protein n=1 Tax=Oribacterium sp. WCC10 TaxID=1855343 RepID=UPI0008E031B8|nr:hypothetical protein [Oribacterium sp. WCC10]SFG73639.1 hypothetical protein SAMN05216356_12239 [Oribacterium sp. WCC10]
MLKISTPFTRDQKANSYIAEFINNRIMSLLINDMEIAAGKDYLKVTYDDDEFRENIRFYFPDHYSKPDAAAAFIALLKGVKSKEAFIPDIYEEYALHAVIHSYIHQCEDNGKSPAKNMPSEARQYVMSVLKNEYLEDGERDEQDPEFLMTTFEDMYDYDEFLTYNMDYGMLDHMTAEEIDEARKSRNAD